MKGVICSKHVEMSDNTFQHAETYATELAAHTASNSAQHGADGCRQLQHNSLCIACYIMLHHYRCVLACKAGRYLGLAAPCLNQNGKVSDFMRHLAKTREDPTDPNPCNLPQPMSHSPTSCSKMVMTVVVASVDDVAKLAPMARPSVKLCAKSAARLR